MRLLRARTRGREEREARRRRAGGSGVDAPGGGEGGGGSRFAAKMPPMPRKRFQNSSIDEREQNRPLASSRRIAYDPFITSHTHPVRVPVLVTIDSKFVVPRARGKTRTVISADCSEVLRLRRRCVAHDRCRAFAKNARLSVVLLRRSRPSSLRCIVYVRRGGAIAPSNISRRHYRSPRSAKKAGVRDRALPGDAARRFAHHIREKREPLELRACHDVMCIVSRACHPSHASLATTIDAVCRCPPGG